jgi:DNA-binding PadR family transcriptional regulator
MVTPRHWLHPQTVPRGFLRLYILTLLSRNPQTGYSIIQTIDEKTEGAWKPGAGTLYPLLKSLLKEGLVKLSGGSGRGVSKTYSLTPRGRRKLDEARRMIAGVGRKEPAMGRLFAELLPGTVFVPMLLRRVRDGADVFKQKVAELPEEERTPLLRELRLALGTQLEWIDSELTKVGPAEQSPGRNKRTP